MEQRLQEAAEAGDINGFYGLLRDDPNVLEVFDKIAFAQTPLHIAAFAGRTHFALEMMRLKPSLGRMLNPDGFSPLDLALRNGHAETVRRLVNYDPQLIRVQGREGVSPLHYVAEVDDADLLAEFLLICPASIEDLTIRAESVAHIAVKNGSFRAFKVLMGWLHRADKIEILSWRNEEGNTVLHIAADTKQPEVLKLIKKKVEVNDKNYEGLTALDMLLRHPDDVIGKSCKKLLSKSRASKPSCLGKMSTLADFLCTSEGIKERLVGLDVYRSFGLSGDMRNAILVVAVLIATATFQAVLQPPGGVSQGDNSPPFLNNTNLNATTNNSNNNNNNNNNNTVFGSRDLENDPGKVVMQKVYFYQFIFWNSITFAASLGIIYWLLPPNRFIILLLISIIFLMIDYIVSAQVIAPLDPYSLSVITLGNLVFIALRYLVSRRRLPRKLTALRRLTGSNKFHDRHEMEILFSLNRYHSSRSDE